ncbi:MAG TPA: hypothetical protein VHB48_19460 [Chitinophagaceae bacterium]|nr:hypothetical protein [Chitinophagaceae bacterium]
MTKNKFKIFCLFLLVGCVMDKLYKTVTIKNDTNKKLIVIVTPKQSLVNDTTVYYYSGYEILPNSIKNLYAMSSKQDIDIYIYSSDTIHTYIKSKKISGIAEHAFLKKISKSKEDLEKNDTVIIK